MKILVTGGAGFIGSSMVDRLIFEGNDVVVVDNLSSGNERHINKEAKFYKLDIQEQKLDSVFQVEKPDYVCHLAAQKDVRISVDDPIFDAKINILGTINILENCVKHNIKKIVFASTGGAIYGEQDVFPAQETHHTRPISPYGITKLVAEHYMYYYKAIHGLDYVSLRYANVYGPRQDPLGEAGVVSIFIKKMLDGEQPVINGDGEQTRDFVYVEDVVQANMSAILNKHSCHILNVGTGIEISINQIFGYLNEILGLSLEEKHASAKTGEQKRSVIDYYKAKEILNWEPKTFILEGLRRTCEYFSDGITISKQKSY